MNAIPASLKTILPVLLLFLLHANLYACRTEGALMISKGWRSGMVNYSSKDTAPLISRIDLENDSVLSTAPLKIWKVYYHAFAKLAASHGASLIILFFSSREKTNWEHDFSPALFEHMGRNMHIAWTTGPVWDHDKAVTNYLYHPYAGSFYYNLVRSKGASVISSFGYTFIGSTLFEYVTEAMFEHPSIQDLFMTPVGGSVFGEAVYRLTIRMSAHGFTPFEKIVTILLNPAYAWNQGFKTINRRVPAY